MGMSGDNFERRFEIVADTRRRWSREEKLAIVKEASVPCTNVSAVARRHSIKPALLYRWKKELSGKAAAALLPVTISGLGDDDEDEPRPLPARAKACVVEIALGNDRMVRVSKGSSMSGYLDDVGFAHLLSVSLSSLRGSAGFYRQSDTQKSGDCSHWTG